MSPVWTPRPGRGSWAALFRVCQCQKTFNHRESEVYVLRALGETGGKADDEHEEKHCERNEDDSPLPG
jgi:hypothetical protein